MAPKLRVILGRAVTGSQVRDILALERAGATPDAIAHRFHLPRTVVDRLIHRRVLSTETSVFAA